VLQQVWSGVADHRRQALQALKSFAASQMAGQPRQLAAGCNVLWSWRGQPELRFLQSGIAALYHTEDSNRDEKGGRRARGMARRQKECESGLRGCRERSAEVWFARLRAKLRHGRWRESVLSQVLGLWRRLLLLGPSKPGRPASAGRRRLGCTRAHGQASWRPAPESLHRAGRQQAGSSPEGAGGGMPPAGSCDSVGGLLLLGEGPGMSTIGTGAGGGAVMRVSRMPTPSIIACGAWRQGRRAGHQRRQTGDPAERAFFREEKAGRVRAVLKQGPASTNTLPARSDPPTHAPAARRQTPPTWPPTACPSAAAGSRQSARPRQCCSRGPPFSGAPRACSQRWRRGLPTPQSCRRFSAPPA
jgi:hypothetical protein